LWSDGAPNNGWLFQTLVGGTDGIDFGSPTAGVAPTLSVSYIVPVPEAGTVAVLPLVVTGMMRRRRRRA